MTRTSRVGAAVTFALAVGAAGGWATTELLAAPPPLAAGPRYLVATVAESTVERQIGLDAKAVWSGGTAVLGARPGTVTGVRISGATTVNSGQVVYEVDLSPVTLAQGSVPAFRDLRVGDVGTDVRQLQALLKTVGTRREAPDGTFGPATAAQVKAWQQRTGQTPTGMVAHGTVLFVPRLPATLALADGLQTGSLAPVGVPALRVLPSAPTFTVALPANQASLTKSGMGVTLAYADAHWSGRIADLGAAGPDGTVTATIGPAKGSVSVCGSTCGKLPPGGGTVSADISVVPLTRGVTVPSQALTLGSDGRAAVVSAEGQSIGVTVRAVSGGVAVVDGLKVGRQIRIPTGG